MKKSTAAAATRRRVLVEPAVHEFWERPNRHRFELGFLVGQSSLLGPDDIVLAAVEVPSEAPDLDHDIEIVQGFDDLSVEWVVEIAKQIDRLLPGGIDIMGLYVVALADAKEAMDQAALYMRAIATALALPPGFQSPTDETDHHCIVHIGSATSAKTVQSFAHVRDAPRTKAVAAQLESPSADPRLAIKTFSARVTVDETIAFRPLSGTGDDLVDVAETRLAELQQQLQPLAQRVWQARGVATTADRMELTTTLSQRAPVEPAGGERETGQCRGVLECVAFVPTQEPRAVELAAFYLKRDFMRSLLARVDLLLERLADDEAAAAGDAFVLRDGGLLQLPKRGLLNWRSGATPSSAALQLSVLALAHEDNATVVQNALEILSAGDELPGLDIDLGVESLRWLEVAVSEDASAASASLAPGVTVSPSSLARPPAKQKTPTTVGKDSNNSTLFVVLPLLLLLLALLYAKFM